MVSLLILSTIGQAKECYNAHNINVMWESYKTLAKIGVKGNFSDVMLTIAHKNSPDIKQLLVDASVQMTLDAIDAHAKIKNSNIATYFTANLSDKKVVAKIVSVTDKNLQLKLTLNKTTKIIPMKYTMVEGTIKAVGVIDAADFGLIKALHTLNMHVAAHKKKGWNDIRIAFDLPVTNTCK